MTHSREILLTAAAIAALAGCAPKAAPVDTSADVAAIKAMQDRELAAVKSGNADTALAVYTSDVMMMPPGEPAIQGAAALRKWFVAFTKDFSATGKYTTNDVQVAGDIGVVHYVGELTMTPKAGGTPMTEAIKGIHIYKRQPDGTWKIAQDVWNSDAPPPPAAK